MEIVTGNVTIDLKPIQNDIVGFYCDNSFSFLCRVCLEKIEVKKMCNIFESKFLRLSTMIMACASVQVSTPTLIALQLSGLTSRAFFWILLYIKTFLLYI